jgi:hypothetical protein
MLGIEREREKFAFIVTVNNVNSVRKVYYKRKSGLLIKMICIRGWFGKMIRL